MSYEKFWTCIDRRYSNRGSVHTYILRAIDGTDATLTVSARDMRIKGIVYQVDNLKLCSNGSIRMIDKK